MAVYFERLLGDDRTSSNSDVSVKTHVSWHSSYPILAVGLFSSTKGGAVKLYNDQGKELGSEIKPKVEANEGNTEEPWWSHVSSLAWHPTRRLLAIAWEKGDITIWNDHDAILQKCSDQRHNEPVLCVKWSQRGSRLMSAGSSGACVAWKVDPNGEMSVVFHHDLKEAVSQLTFKMINETSHSQVNKEIRKLAKAAIDGDDTALDMFVPSATGFTVPNNDRTIPKFANESLDCYLGTSNGNVFYINGNGSCTEVAQNSAPIYRMLYYSERDILIAITSSLQLCTYQSSYDGALNELSKIKVISKSSEPNFCLAGTGILAMTAGENLIRIFNIDTNNSYVLNINKSSNQFTEIVTAIAYNDKMKMLAAGTNMGTVVTWHYQKNSNGDTNSEEEFWTIQTPSSIHGTVKDLQWSLESSCLVVNTQQQVFILNQHILCSHYNQEIGGVQISANQVSLFYYSHNVCVDLKTDIQITGLYVSTNYVAVWSTNKLILYEYDAGSSHITPAGNFDSSSKLVAVNEHSVFVAQNHKILVKTIQGTVKQALSFTDEEGLPTCIDILNNVLVVGTTEGYIKIWDLSRREVKPHSQPRCVIGRAKNFKGFHSVRMNCNGTKISFIIYDRRSDTEPNPNLYVWDLEGDCVKYFNHRTGKSDDDSELSADDEDLSLPERLRSQAAKDLNGRFPKSHFWDAKEPRLLVCEASLSSMMSARKERKEEKSSIKPGRRNDFKAETQVEYLHSTMVVSFFVTSEHGIMIQDQFSLEDQNSQLVGVRVPFYYVYAKPRVDKQQDEPEDSISKSKSKRKSVSDSNSENDNVVSVSKDQNKMYKLIRAQSMRDFVGLETSDDATKAAMMNFCFFLTVGNMDEAFKAIKTIRSENVWENMAKMCVKTKRLDVASVCLGKMGHARGAKALREAIATIADPDEVDARVAVLAVHLGMLDEAEKLYKSSGRYDLLNKMYQDSNQWEKALDTAENKDRINLRTTFYNYAKHLESVGNTRAAISFFENSDTHHFEVPRMLLDDPDSLDQYIQRCKDRQLWRWWAQYMESTGEMETALRYYEGAQDHLALVRVYCYWNNLEKAAEIANESGDKLACFHLGRQHENNGNIKEAVHFFSRAHAYSNAVRLCKENGLEDQLLNLALMSGPEGMVDAARYYEDKEGLEDKAVMLYHKAGYLSKAVELAFRVKEFSTLQHIANDLDDKADPELLKRCAQFFIENGHFDRAVDLLSIGKKYIDALDLCMEHHVTMNEKLAERLTPPKSDPDQRMRTDILERIAECAMSQDNYHLATKKFTQAGNKIQAMKALLKSGDTEKIIFFAGVSRQKEIYVLAANYLQSLDWKKDPEIMKNIISFYTKGRALDLLSSFYDACAQVEIDEYQNYEKALGALNEACKCLSKSAQSTPAHEQMLSQLKMKIELVKKYVQATRLYDEDPDEAMKMCKLLLQEDMLELGVRKGDVYAVMVEHYVKVKNFQVAHALIEEMRVRIPKVNLTYYLDATMVQTVYSNLELPLPNHQPLDEEEDVNMKSRPQTAVGYVEDVYDSDDEDKATNDDELYHRLSDNMNVY
ncbi:IFT140 (predicted) [Pycnogonum litorale]